MVSPRRRASSHPAALRLALCALLLVGVLPLLGAGAPGVVPTSTGEDPLTQGEVAAVRAQTPPFLTARAAALVDGCTGRVLWSMNGDRRLAPASTAKMMTALLAVELADPSEVAVVRPRDLVGGSTAGLQAGEELTIEQLLYAALIPSGNDAAVTIADHVGREYLGGVGDGGVDAFVAAMNRRARAMGLRNTRFVNPNGYDAPGQYTSALDLARLGRAVLREPLLADVVATARYSVVGQVRETGRQRSLVRHRVETTNELLGTYPGANGIKTGTTPDAGQALVASVRRSNARLISVVLGSSDRFADTRALLDWGYGKYEWLPLSAAAFSSPLLVPSERSAYAAVEAWNTDLLLLETVDGRPRFFAGTEPVDVLPIGGSTR